MSNTTYSKRIAKFLEEEYSVNTDYTSPENISKLIEKLFKNDGTVLMFDSRVLTTLRSIPDKFEIFEIKHGENMYTHMRNDGYSYYDKIFYTTGAFLQDIRKI